MITKLATICLISTLLAAFVTHTAQAQRYSRWNTEQNNPPPSEVVVARWTFGHNGWFGGYGWAHNYPTSDQHFNEFIKGATGIDIDRMSYRIVRLGDDDVFDYPFAYIDDGAIVMIAGHNNDLANFWDWYDRPRMPLGPATDAFRLGVNYMVYALTH